MRWAAMSAQPSALVFSLAMPVLTRLHIILRSYVGDGKTLHFWGDKQFGVFPVALPIWKRWQNVLSNGKKELGMPLSRHRWAVAGYPSPLPKLGPPRRYAGSADHVPPSRKSGRLLVGGFVEFQLTLDGTEPQAKLVTLLPSHSLKADFRTSE